MRRTNSSASFASFEEPSATPPLGIQLTAIDRPYDAFHIFTQALINDVSLVERYNALKVSHDGSSMDRYRIAKSHFIEGVLATLQPAASGAWRVKLRSVWAVLAACLVVTRETRALRIRLPPSASLLHRQAAIVASVAKQHYRFLLAAKFGQCANAMPKITTAMPARKVVETGSPRKPQPSAAAVGGASAWKIVTRVGVVRA